MPHSYILFRAQPNMLFKFVLPYNENIHLSAMLYQQERWLFLNHLQRRIGC